MNMMDFDQHKRVSKEFANYYEFNERKIDKGIITLHVDPSVALEFKARMMYLTGGYPISQSHMYKDATFAIENCIVNNINRALMDPDSILYDGLATTKDQNVESTKYMDTIVEMASEKRYKNKYINQGQIERRFEKKYKRKMQDYPAPSFVRDINLLDRPIPLYGQIKRSS